MLITAAAVTPLAAAVMPLVAAVTPFVAAVTPFAASNSDCFFGWWWPPGYCDSFKHTGSYVIVTLLPFPINVTKFNNLCYVRLINTVILTSTATISEPGTSNMASSRSFSRMPRSPLAPVFRLMASRAIAFRAPSVNVRSTCVECTECYTKIQSEGICEEDLKLLAIVKLKPNVCGKSRQYFKR